MSRTISLIIKQILTFQGLIKSIGKETKKKFSGQKQCREIN